MKILVNPTQPYLPFWQLVRHLGNTNFAGKSASMQNFPALFMLPEENVYEDCGSRRQFMTEEWYILLWIICQTVHLSNSK